MSLAITIVVTPTSRARSSVYISSLRGERTMAKAIRELEKHGIEDAISTGYSILEELGQELRDWYDNLPESFQDGDKGSTLDEGASTLENLSAVEVSDALAKVLTDEIVTVTPMKKRASRATRRDYAVTLL